MAFWKRHHNDEWRRGDEYYRRDEELTGRADRDRERLYEQERAEGPRRHLDEREGAADRYRVERGPWSGAGYDLRREMMEDQRYRSDMPGMESRGDYGMDDPRRRYQTRGEWENRRPGDRGIVTGWDRDRDVQRRSYGESYTQRTGSPTWMRGNPRVHDQSLGSSLGDVGRGWSGELGDWERPAGRGPRGYTRSDDRIREDVCDHLMQAWMNSEDVDVSVEGGEVTLRGLVDNRQEKRAIEDLTEMVLGVKEVHNQLRVRTGLRAKLGHAKDENPNYHGMLTGTGTEPLVPGPNAPAGPTQSAGTGTTTTGSNGQPRTLGAPPTNPTRS